MFNPSCEGVPNGVQLHTYHSCKGLQWKYVILTSLNYNVEDKGEFVRKNIYGVSALHAESPTADNPFPEVYIRLLPWVFGAVNANIPDVILDHILADTGCMSEYHSMIAENNRILYVGMTRPSDVLMLNIEEPKKKETLLISPLMCFSQILTPLPHNHGNYRHTSKAPLQDIRLSPLHFSLSLFRNTSYSQNTAPNCSVIGAA